MERKVEAIEVEQRCVRGIKEGRHERQGLEQFWPALSSAQWHWIMGLDAKPAIEQADILTSPVHNDNSQNSERNTSIYLPNSQQKARIISDRIRESHTKETKAKDQTPKPHSRRKYVPTPSRYRSLRPHRILFRRAFMRAGTVLALLGPKHVPGFAPRDNSYHSHSTILSWLWSGAFAKTT